MKQRNTNYDIPRLHYYHTSYNVIDNENGNTKNVLFKVTAT